MCEKERAMRKRRKVHMRKIGRYKLRKRNRDRNIERVM